MFTSIGAKYIYKIDGIIAKKKNEKSKLERTYVHGYLVMYVDVR